MPDVSDPADDGFDDDDLDVSPGGPVPAPAERTWRHPSEIAAGHLASSGGPSGDAAEPEGLIGTDIRATAGGGTSTRAERPSGAAILVVAAMVAFALVGGAAILLTGAADRGTTDASPTPDTAASQAISAVADRVAAAANGSHGWLGIHATDLDARTMSDLDLDGGAKIVTVVDDGPAHRAGLQVGDLIVSVQRVSVLDTTDLLSVLRLHAPGDHVAVAVLRSGAELTMTVTLARRAEP